MKNFMDRCLPFYFSEGLKNKKIILVAMGGFKSLVDYDKDGNCIWCKKNNLCERSVLRCLDSLKYFSEHLGLRIFGTVHAFHGNPQAKEKELIKLGKKIDKKLIVEKAGAKEKFEKT